MAVDLIPAGIMLGALASNEAVIQNSLVWKPHEPPRPITPGELDCDTTLRNRIYWQWQQGPNWQTLAGILALACEQLGAERFQVATYRYLSTGFGAILDELGALVGLERGGLPEELYRRAIPVRGASLLSDGGIDSVMAPVKKLLGPEAVNYVPAYPAGFCWVVLIAVSPTMLDLLLVLLPPLVPEGVGAKLLLAPPESPGWDYSTPEAWAASWSSAYGAVDASVVAPWGYAVTVG